MVLFAFAVWDGPSRGSVLAALLAEARDWRWAFYFSLMLGVLAVIFMITIP
jgi:predicted MFS family arabinose efflux permease